MECMWERDFPRDLHPRGGSGSRTNTLVRQKVPKGREKKVEDNRKEAQPPPPCSGPCLANTRTSINKLVTRASPGSLTPAATTTTPKR